MTPLGRRVAIVLGYMTAVLIAMLVVEALVDLWRYLRCRKLVRQGLMAFGTQSWLAQTAQTTSH